MAEWSIIEGNYPFLTELGDIPTQGDSFGFVEPRPTMAWHFHNTYPDFQNEAVTETEEWKPIISTYEKYSTWKTVLESLIKVGGIYKKILRSFVKVKTIVSDIFTQFTGSIPTMAWLFDKTYPYFYYKKPEFTIEPPILITDGKVFQISGDSGVIADAEGNIGFLLPWGETMSEEVSRIENFNSTNTPIPEGWVKASRFVVDAPPFSFMVNYNVRQENAKMLKSYNGTTERMLYWQSIGTFSDFEVTCEIIIDDIGKRSGIVLRKAHADGGENYIDYAYVFLLDTTNGNNSLYSGTYYQDASAGSITLVPYSFSTNTPYMVRVKLIANSIYFKCWEKSNLEPTEWNIVYQNYMVPNDFYVSEGYCGIYDSGAGVTWFRDFTVVAARKGHYARPAIGYPKLIPNALNGKPVIRLDNAILAFTRHLGAVWGSGTGEYTIFMVIKTTKPTYNKRLYSNYKFAFGFITQGILYSQKPFNNTAVSKAPFNTSAFQDDAWMISVNCSTPYQLQLNREDIEQTGTATYFAENPLHTLGLDTWSMDVAEIIIYSRPLKLVERRQVEAYLAEKYGIALAEW